MVSGTDPASIDESKIVAKVSADGFSHLCMMTSFGQRSYDTASLYVYGRPVARFFKGGVEFSHTGSGLGPSSSCVQ